MSKKESTKKPDGIVKPDPPSAPPLRNGNKEMTNWRWLEHVAKQDSIMAQALIELKQEIEELKKRIKE